MRLLFFAQLKTATGCAATDLPVTGELDADALWQQLLDRHPALAPHQRTTRLARNGTYAGPGTRFSNTDEVALIPPVSGG